MDPVNKWLTVVILFMLTVVVVLWQKGEVGRYEMQVVPQTGDVSAIYVLDTKEGTVSAQMIDEAEELTLDRTGKPRSYPVEVFKPKRSTDYRRY